MLRLKTICQHICKNKNKLFWIRDDPTQDDLNHVLKEGFEPSKFDALGLKKQTIEDLQAGKAKLVCRSCSLAKVLAVVYPGQIIPWDLFGKIFAAFGNPSEGKWRFLWFANPTLRTDDFGLGPEAVNGGYTYPCRPDTIVVYRKEEVGRVLVHELLHAACTDNMNDPIELREAKTETWAEIFMCAILADGNIKEAMRLWEIQAQWIVDQEENMRKSGVNTPEEYAWRYTVARKYVLETMNISLPKTKSNSKSTNSTRLTFMGF